MPVLTAAEVCSSTDNIEYTDIKQEQATMADITQEKTGEHLPPEVLMKRYMIKKN